MAGGEAVCAWKSTVGECKVQRSVTGRRRRRGRRPGSGRSGPSERVVGREPGGRCPRRSRRGPGAGSGSGSWRCSPLRGRRRFTESGVALAAGPRGPGRRRVPGGAAVEAEAPRDVLADQAGEPPRRRAAGRGGLGGLGEDRVDGRGPGRRGSPGRRRLASAARGVISPGRAGSASGWPAGSGRRFAEEVRRSRGTCKGVRGHRGGPRRRAGSGSGDGPATQPKVAGPAGNRDHRGPAQLAAKAVIPSTQA